MVKGQVIKPDQKRIFGRVTKENGEPLANVRIILEFIDNPSTEKLTTITSVTGEYKFEKVSEGTYRLLFKGVLDGRDLEKTISKRFHSLLTKVNKEHPRPTDIQDLKDLLYDNKGMELWKAVIGMGELAESQALDTILNGSGQGMRECWRQRLQAMRADLGYSQSPALERLLIQQVTLCWLNLNLTEYRLTNVMKQSIWFECGLYWEKRLTAAQRRFARACETLTRVRKLSRNTPALQFNSSAVGGQQVNVST